VHQAAETDGGLLPDFAHPGQKEFLGALTDEDPLRALFPRGDPVTQPAPSEPRVADAVYTKMSYGGEAAIADL
jgi:hypothetical protein